jgi:UDPglucose 6-dehydrogenase
LNLGMIGLGKIGLPIALTLEYHGRHQVVGYDVSPLPAKILAGEADPPQEEGIGPLLEASSLKVLPSTGDVVAESDVVFVAVQTPHAPAYGGEVPAPAEPRDFEYAYLVQAVRDVCRAAQEQGKDITVVVVSTVLPGTTNRLLWPLVNDHVKLIYSPAFIAMGTTVKDFCAPEFVLAGVQREGDEAALRQVLGTVHRRPVLTMSIPSAELAKVAYNTFISAKIVFANTVMEICHKTGADCDDVTGALARATDRVISPRYLSGGMGDGGACHPRDGLAMSWLAERLDLSYDLMGEMTRAREAQAGWLADLTVQYAELTGLPIVILGKAYKPGSDLTAGSPALLLAQLIGPRSPWPANELTGGLTAPGLTAPRPQQWDPHTDDCDAPDYRAVYVIGTRHPEFERFEFPAGSVVLDPWGYIPDAQGVTVIRIGRKS